MFLFIRGFEEGVSQMLPERRPRAEARHHLHVGMYLLLACAVNYIVVICSRIQLILL